MSQDIIKEFYKDKEKEIYNERVKLSRVKEAVGIWRLYLDIGAPDHMLADQHDIILSTLKKYCGEGSWIEFGETNRSIIIHGEDGIQLTI